MAENGAKIFFEASFNEGSFNAVIKRLEELTRKKYDVKLNPIIDKKTGEKTYEASAKELKSMVADAKNIAKEILPELDKLDSIDTSKSVSQLIKLSEALNTLKSLKNFSYQEYIKGDDSKGIADTTTTKLLFDYDSFKTSLKGIQNFDTTSLDSLISSVENFINRFAIVNNDLIKEATSDPISIKNAFSTYGNMLFESANQTAENIESSADTLIKKVQALKIILNNIDLFEEIQKGKSPRVNDFKTFLTEKYGTSQEIDDFFKKYSELFKSTGFKNFAKDTQANYNKAFSDLNSSIIDTSQIPKIATSFNSNLENNLKTKQALNDDLKYNISVDASQLKNVLTIIDEVKKKLEELQNNKVTLSLDDNFKGKLTTLNTYIEKFKELRSGQNISIEVNTKINAKETLEQQLADITKNKATIIFDSNVKDIISQLESSIKNINENSKINLVFNEKSLQNFNSQIAELENKLARLNNASKVVETNKQKSDTSKEKEVLAEKNNITKTLNEITKSVNDFNKNVKIQPDINIEKITSNLNDAIKNIHVDKKIPIDTNIKISKTKINNAINSFKSVETKKLPKIVLDIKPNITNNNIEEQAKKTKAILNEKLSKGITAKLSKINYSDAVKTLNEKISKTKLNSIKLPITTNKKDVTSLVRTIQQEINNSKVPLSVTIKSFKVDNALESLRNSIEEKLSNIGITLSIKGNPDLIEVVNKNINGDTTSTKVTRKSISSAINQYTKIKDNATKLISQLNKLSNIQFKPIITDELNNLKDIITQCEENIKALTGDISKLDTQSLNKLINTNVFKDYITDSSNTVGILKELSTLQSNLTSNLTGLKNKYRSNKEYDDYLNTVDQLQNRLSNLDYSNLENVQSELRDISNEYNILNSKIKEFTSLDTLGKNAQKTINKISPIIKSLENYNIDAKTSSVTGGSSVSPLTIDDTSIISQENTLTQNLINLQDTLNKKTSEYNTLKEKSASAGITQQEQQQLEKLTVDIKSLITSYEQLNKISDNVIGKAKTDTASSKLDSKYTKLINDVQTYMSKNGRAINDFNIKSQLESIINDANDTNITRNMNHLSGLQNRFNLLQTQITKLGKAGKSVAQELDNIFSKIGLKAILGTMIYRVIGYFKEMINSVIEVDTSMVSLKRVTSETSETYSEFLKNASADARKLGTTLTGIIDAVTNFSRLGYNLEDATTLGNLATMYATVGLIDVDTATNDIISSMKAFNIEADRAITIVDAFNEIGNKFALSSADVGNGLTQSASALAVAGNDINQSIAMITGATEITQDADSVGNALKILSMRIRGSKTDLSSMGEDVDDLANSTSKMRDEIKALSGVDIMSDSQTYKSTFQIMREIAEIWNDLSDINQAGLLEKLAGKNRANQISALLSNWSQVEKAYQISLNASGSAEKENEKYVDSLAGRIEVIKASAQGFSKSAISDDFLKDVLKTVDNLIVGATKLTSIIGGIPMLIASIGTAYGVMNKKFGNFGLVKEDILKALKIDDWKTINSSSWRFDESISQTNTNKLENLLNGKNTFSKLFNYKEITKVAKSIGVISDKTNEIYDGNNSILSNGKFKELNKLTQSLNTFAVEYSKKFYKGDLFSDEDLNLIKAGTKEISKTFNEYNGNINKFKSSSDEFNTWLTQQKFDNNSVFKNYFNQALSSGKQASFQGWNEYLKKLNFGNDFKSTILQLDQYNKLSTDAASRTDMMTEAQYNYLNTLNAINPKLATTLQSINQAGVSFTQLTTKMILSTVASKGLSVALGFVRGVLSGLASYVIMACVQGIITFVKNLGKISDEAKESAENLSELTSQVKEYTSKLKELKEQQEKAIEDNNTQDVIDTNKELLELQQELVDTYGIQANGIDLINGKLSEQLDILQNIETTESDKFLRDNGKDITLAQKKYYDEYQNSTKDLVITNSWLSSIFGFGKLSYINSAYNKELKQLTEDFGAEWHSFYSEDSPDANKLITIEFNLDENSIQGAIDKYEEFYQYVKEKGISTGEDYSEILEGINNQIEKLESEDYENYKQILDEANQSIVNTSTDTYGQKTLKEYETEVQNLISQYNDAITNGDNDLANTTFDKLNSLHETLKSYYSQMATYTDPNNSKITGVGLPNFIENWFTSFEDKFSEEVGKSKIDDILQDNLNSLLLKKNFFGRINLDVISDLQFDNFDDISDSNYVQGLEKIKSLSEETGLSVEDIVNYLTELGYIEKDISQYTPQIKTSIDNISNVIADTINQLGGSSDTLETFSDHLELISSAYEDLTSKGTISSENLLSLLANGYSSAIQNINYSVGSEKITSVYTLQREELEKLIKAKYNNLKADALTNKQNLENAKKQDLEDIANQPNEQLKYMMQVKYDEQGYDKAIAEIDNVLDTIEYSFNETMEKISVNNIALSGIETLTTQLEGVSSAFEKIQKGDSLSASDLNTIIDNGFGDAIELDEESGLLTINIDKYKQLAQAKISAYSVDTQNSINSLNSEQRNLQSQIAQYQSMLNNSSSSTSDKAYASSQISRLTDEYDNNSVALQENQVALKSWQKLESEIGDVTNGAFNNVLTSTKNLESSASTMSSAFKEVKDNGYLSVSTMMNLIDSGYANCIVLDEQSNLLTLDAQAYLDVANAQIQAQLTSLQERVARGEATQQIYSQIQALQLLQGNLASVTTGSYGNNTDYWKSEAEEQFSYLEHLRNMNVIDNAHYYQYLSELNDEYYKDRIEYIDDYRKYEEEIYKGLLEVQKEALESQKEGLESQKEYLESCKDNIDDQIDVLESEKDAIQDQIDALKDKNEEEERALELQEAQLRLQNALNQKTIRVFTEELGWTWEADQDEIKEAQQEVNDLLEEEEIAQLEAQQDAIDDEIDGLKAQQDAIDDEIDAIQKQEDLLDKQIDALENQLNATHVNELTHLNDNINQFTKLSQENINKLLGLPADFDTRNQTSIKNPIENLKNSVDISNQTLSELKNQSISSGLLSGGNKLAQTLTVNIDRVVTDNPYDFVSQITTILKQQM